MMMMTLRKSALRPLLSVSVPWSMTCSSTLKTSGGLLDLVEQQHGMRLLGDGLGQQAALVETDVAGRRADQAAHRVPLHVLGHVEADQLDAEDVGQLLGDFSLADAGRAAEQEGANRLVGPTEARARHLDGGRQRIDGRVCPNTTLFKSRSRVLSLLRSSLDTWAGGMRAILATMSSTSARVMVFFCLLLGKMRCGTGLVDDVNGLVRQMAVVDELGRELGRRLQSAQRARCVVLLEARLQALEDLDGLLDRGLGHVDLLETPRQRRVLSKMPRYSVKVVAPMHFIAPWTVRA